MQLYFVKMKTLTMCWMKIDLNNIIIKNVEGECTYGERVCEFCDDEIWNKQLKNVISFWHTLLALQTAATADAVANEHDDLVRPCIYRNTEIHNTSSITVYDAWEFQHHQIWFRSFFLLFRFFYD